VGVTDGVQVAVGTCDSLVGLAVQVALSVGARTVAVSVGSVKRVAVGSAAACAPVRGAVTARINAAIQATIVNASIAAVTML
jgi:hypothetical protein